MVVKLEYKAISAKVYELINLAREVKCEIENMENTVEELGVFWKSEAQAEHVMRVTADLYNAKAFLESIKQNIKILAETVKKFDEAECMVAELIREM